MKRSIISVFAATLALTGAANADVITIPAAADATIYAQNSQGNYFANGAGEYLFAGKNDQNEARRALIRFDLSSIPAGSTITQATLTLHQSRSRSATNSVSLYRLLASWSEGASNPGNNEGQGVAPVAGDTTWLHRAYNTQLWTTSGGDFASTPSASANVTGQNVFFTWSSAGMVSDIQAWVDQPAANFGWIIRGVETASQTAHRFDSRTNGNTGNRPALTVTYTPPSTLGACCVSGTCTLTTSAQCASLGGTFQGAGSSCSPNPCPQATGACCIAGSCSVLTQSQCLAQGGSYRGDGVPCTPNPCAGACCLPTGYCVVATTASCAAQGGVYQGDGTDCAGVTCPIVLTPFVDELPRPGVAQPVSGQAGGEAHYRITMNEVFQRFHRDLPLTRVWGYAGSYPGPTIEARTGLPVTVDWVNDLRVYETGVLRTTHALAVDTCVDGAVDAAAAVVHVHGAKTNQASDGYPEYAFPPGQESGLYTYPNEQQAGTIWYHDHAMGITRLNVYMGLAGFYFIRDDVEDALDLPRGEYEIGLAIQDRSFNPDGSLKYPAMWMEHFYGDFIVVNGKVWPYLEVDRGKYRFRMLNGSTSRTYTLALSNGATFWQIGTENGLVQAPVPLTQLTIQPGERADVVIDFAPYAAGTRLTLTNSALSPYPNGGAGPDISDVMQFVVESQAGHTAALPGTLRPFEPIPEGEAALQRDIQLLRMPNPCPEHAGDMWTLNGLLWHDITEQPRIGTTEIWAWVNRSGVSHPMHMHLVSFQVLDRQDFVMQGGVVVPVGPRVPPAANELGWKDTVQCTPNQITRVITRFEGYPGRYAYHCHILEHEEHAMMRQFEVQCEAPSIVTPPASLDLCVGESAAFTVAASGDVLRYRWRLDGADLTDGPTPYGSVIDGADSPVLTISNLHTYDAGSYTCRVTNPCGTAAAGPAVLTVDPCSPCDPDVNCDGSVNGFDIEATEQAVNGDYANFCQATCDLNRDGAENGFDIEVEEQRVNGAPC